MPFTKGVRWKCAGEGGPSTPMKFTVALLCRPGLKAGEVVTESDPLTAIEMSRHWSNRGYCQHLTIRSQRVTGSTVMGWLIKQSIPRVKIAEPPID